MRFEVGQQLRKTYDGTVVTIAFVGSDYIRLDGDFEPNLWSLSERELMLSMSQPWKRLSNTELQSLRSLLFQDIPEVMSTEQAQRLFNERDALEHALSWAKDDVCAENEFLTMMEICSELREEVTALKQRLAEYEQPVKWGEIARHQRNGWNGKSKSYEKNCWRSWGY